MKYIKKYLTLSNLHDIKIIRVDFQAKFTLLAERILRENLRSFFISTAKPYAMQTCGFYILKETNK